VEEEECSGAGGFWRECGDCASSRRSMVDSLFGVDVVFMFLLGLIGNARGIRQDSDLYQLLKLFS